MDAQEGDKLLDGDDKEGGEREKSKKVRREKMWDDLSDVGSSASARHSSESEGQSESEEEDLTYEGGAGAKVAQADPKADAGVKGKYKFTPEQRDELKLIFKDGNYYKEKPVFDPGYRRWAGAYDQTAKAVEMVGAFVTFKFYRMTYSYFMGRKQFLCLYQKKKFKKMTLILTLLSMFFTELPIIICNVKGISSLPATEQLIITLIDTLCLCVFLIVLEFRELRLLDDYMRTVNVTGHRQRKSAAACESTEDSDDLGYSSEEEDDYPDWRLMLKNVEGNPHLFRKTAV